MAQKNKSGQVLGAVAGALPAMNAKQFTVNEQKPIGAIQGALVSKPLATQGATVGATSSEPYNIDNVRVASPVRYTTQPTPVIQPRPFEPLPVITSQDPSKSGVNPNAQSNNINNSQLLTGYVSQDPSKVGTNPNQTTGETQKINQGTSPNFQSDFAKTTDPNTAVSQLAQERTRLETEITDLTKKISEIPASTIEAKKKMGIYDDEKRLEELSANLSNVKNDLLTAQDEEVGIRERGRSLVSQFGGTQGDFGATTGESFRRNALDQLTLSRTYSRLGDAVSAYQASINNNISILNENAKAEQSKYEFEIEQKNSILNQVIETQGNILTEQQKEKLETIKHQNEVSLLDKKIESEQKNILLTNMVKSGKISGTDLSGMADMSFFDINKNIAQGSSSSTNAWLSWDKETAYANLDEKTFERWEKYQGLDKGSQEESMSREARVSATGSLADTIDKLLDNRGGLGDSVGVGLGRFNINPMNAGEVSTFRVDMANLASVLVLDTVKNLKASGATLGAISDAELRLLQNAGNTLGFVVDGDGRMTGKSKLPEEVFTQRLKEIQNVALKVNLLNSVGKDYYDKYKIKNMDNDELKMFREGVDSGEIVLEGSSSLVPAISGVDFDKIIKIESGGSYTAVNPTSGAFGKYQFIPSTFEQYRQRLGLTESEAKTPQGQDSMFELFTADNIKGLESSGIPVNTATVYLAHQQGLGGARQILNGNISPTVRRNLLANLPAGYQGKDDGEIINGWLSIFLPRLS